MFFAFSPALPRRRQGNPPPELEPYESIRIPCRGRPGSLAGTWYPARGDARGAVLLVHPWVAWGKAYFHRRGRLEALRQAGYHALTFDLPGFGNSAPPRGFYDIDVEAALDVMTTRAEGLPLHLWGISAGGYWSHLLLSRDDRITGAMFEDVARHLIQWSWRTTPMGRPLFALFRLLWRRSYPFLDLARHAPCLRVQHVTYVGGGGDRAVRADETKELAHRAKGDCLIVPGAGHLASIKQANGDVIGLALDTFSKAEARVPSRGVRQTPSDLLSYG